MELKEGRNIGSYSIVNLDWIASRRPNESDRSYPSRLRGETCASLGRWIPVQYMLAEWPPAMPRHLARAQDTPP